MPSCDRAELELALPSLVYVDYTWGIKFTFFNLGSRYKKYYFDIFSIKFDFTRGNHRLFSRVIYSTLFQSQLSTLFYLESGTQGKMGVFINTGGEASARAVPQQLGKVGYLCSLFLLRA